MTRRNVANGKARAYPVALDEYALLEGVDALVAMGAGLAGIVARFGPPPLWSRPQGYATLARIILEQQVSLASAGALFDRLNRELRGGLAPRAVAEAGESGLRALGVTRQKASYLLGAARHSLDHENWYAELALLQDGDALARLRELRGVGEWTASIYLLMALRRPDLWPTGDLALQRMLGRILERTSTPTAEESTRLALRWRPWRAVAARILWQGYLGGWR